MDRTTSGTASVSSKQRQPRRRRPPRARRQPRPRPRQPLCRRQPRPRARRQPLPRARRPPPRRRLAAQPSCGSRVEDSTTRLSRVRRACASLESSLMDRTTSGTASVSSKQRQPRRRQPPRARRSPPRRRLAAQPSCGSRAEDSVTSLNRVRRACASLESSLMDRTTSGTIWYSQCVLSASTRMMTRRGAGGEDEAAASAKMMTRRGAGGEDEAAASAKMMTRRGAGGEDEAAA
eukprot:119651_1